MHKIEGISIDDVFNLSQYVFGAGKKVVIDEVLEAFVMRVDDMGLRLDHDVVPGPSVTRYYLIGRRWRVWLDVGNAQFRATDGSPNLVKYMTSSYRRVFDWDFIGDGDDFYTDMTTARMFGYV